jgi:hypothetical protein
LVFDLQPRERELFRGGLSMISRTLAKVLVTVLVAFGVATVAERSLDAHESAAVADVDRSAREVHDRFRSLSSAYDRARDELAAAEDPSADAVLRPAFATRLAAAELLAQLDRVDDYRVRAALIAQIEGRLDVLEAEISSIVPRRLAH